MFLWGYYFLAKLGLYAGRWIDFHWLPNLALLLFVMLPLPTRAQRLLRGLVALPLAVLLLVHDGWLPLPVLMATLSGGADGLEPRLLPALPGLLVDAPLLVSLIAFGLLYLVLAMRLRMQTWALLGVLAVPLFDATGHGHGAVRWQDRSTALPPLATLPATESGHAPAGWLAAFRAEQAGLRVRLPALPADARTPDLIFIQVPGLGWTDIDAAGVDAVPLLRRFDVLLTGFGSAAADESAATARLLRALCGHAADAALAAPAEPPCRLADRLAGLGYRLEARRNHRYAAATAATAAAAEPQAAFAPAPAPVQGPRRLLGYRRDGSIVWSDADQLDAWWQARRAATAAGPVALLYHSASLADDLFLDDPETPPARRAAQRIEQLVGAIYQLVDRIEADGGRALVFLVPAHGGNVVGDRQQVAGLRVLPTPAVTAVPAGLIVAGRGRSHGLPLVNPLPTSWQAIGALLAGALDPAHWAAAEAAAPGPNRLALRALAATLPETPSVGERGGAVAIASAGAALLTIPGHGWVTAITPPPRTPGQPALVAESESESESD